MPVCLPVQFEPTTQSHKTEKEHSLNILSSALGHPTSAKRARAEGHDANPVVNVRKAIRFENKRESASRGGKGRSKGRGK